MAVPKAVGRRHDPAAALGSTYVPRLRGSYSAPLATLARLSGLAIGVADRYLALAVGDREPASGRSFVRVLPAV